MKHFFSIVLLSIFCSNCVIGQETDSVKTVISTNQPTEQFEADTVDKQENTFLDISKDRGLYIQSSDGQMQLRILGSVRFSAFYDFVEMPVKNTFNTYFVPTGADNKKIPNYFNSLTKSRLGFEITRKVEGKDVFIRLESDFEGPNDQFRIRHAYGEVGRLRVGQTWSLFSNVLSLPPMVDNKGPTGSVTLRTAQVRFSSKSDTEVNWAVAAEYSRPDLTFDVNDTSGLSTVQVIPDLTARIQRKGKFGLTQLSWVVTTISIKNAQNDLSSSFGFGASLSGILDLPKSHKLLYQVTYGKSISHFITTFSGTNNDAVYNPTSEDVEGLTSFGGFLSYGLNLHPDIQSHASLGYAKLENKNFQQGNAFHRSISLSLDSFYEVAEGARIGLEYVYGQRWNKDGSNGQASRIWALFYYDF